MRERSRLRVMPSRMALAALGVCAVAILIALILGTTVAVATLAALAALLCLCALAVWDYVSSRDAWRRSSPRLIRRLPPAFAIGAKRLVHLTIQMEGRATWRCELYDHADARLVTEGLPMTLTLVGGKRLDTAYNVVPTRRGEVIFAPADVRVRSRLGLCELLETLGAQEMRRVYPDFSQVARYAWLAGDRRLQEIGIKTYHLRGQGTDFKQLSEYRVGDPVRHIDWRATLRIGKPIVRQFQDDRDQCVLLLVDCGRRMRADERNGVTPPQRAESAHWGPRIETTHFDQVLNAIMLLSYVALKQGDAVGALTFGTPAGQERSFAPRKGAQALNALMGQLYDVQPTLTHSDYVAAAQHLLSQQHKRALVIVITNFRDEDSPELDQALRLLRPRHLVLLASLRERIVSELMTQPVVSGDAAIDIASAHLYEQSRRDAFRRLASQGRLGTLMVDAEPERLGIELVNRYHAVKRAGLM